MKNAARTRFACTEEAVALRSLSTVTEIRALPSLRWIHLVSAGVDHLLPLGWLLPIARLAHARATTRRRAR